MPFYFDETETRGQPRGEGAEQPRELRLRLIGGRFVVAAPEKEEEELLSWDHALEMAISQVREILKEPVSKNKGSLDMFFSLVLLRNGLDLNEAKKDLPFNSQLVPAAGAAVLESIATVAEAAVMKSRVVGLKESLEEWGKLGVLSQSFGYANEVIEANKSRVLNDISTKSENALKRVDSLLVDNIALRRALKDALALRKEPAEQAKKTRVGRKRVAAEAVAGVEATTPDPATPEVTQTTVTTTQPKTAPVKPPTPKSRSRSKEK